NPREVRFCHHAKRGWHPPALLQPPSIELLDRFHAAARGHIRLMTIAPEPNAAASSGPWTLGPGPSPALDLIAHASALGVKISLGHSNATAAETLAAIDAGATGPPHPFNAMRPLDHREPGILGIVLDDDRLFAELICDGVHVEPPVVRLWLKSKSETRAILVTDAMSAAGMPDGDYMLGQFSVSVANGRAQLKEDIAAGKETLAG